MFSFAPFCFSCRDFFKLVSPHNAIHSQKKTPGYQEEILLQPFPFNSVDCYRFIGHQKSVSLRRISASSYVEQANIHSTYFLKKRIGQRNCTSESQNNLSLISFHCSRFSTLCLLRKVSDPCHSGFVVCFHIMQWCRELKPMHQNFGIKNRQYFFRNLSFNRFLRNRKLSSETREKFRK